MEIIGGSDRLVISGSRYTAKFARTNPNVFIRNAFQIGRKRGVKAIFTTWRVETADSFSAMKRPLFHGIVANRREQKLARLFDVVTPTRSLLFGLVNVQPTTGDLPVHEQDISKAFVEGMKHPGRDIPRLGHMLEESANFGIHEGAVKFRDGGERGLERTLATSDGFEGVTQALGILTAKYCQADALAK